MAGQRMPVQPRAEIGASWDRVLRSGIDPEQTTQSVLLELEEIEHRRRSSALGEIMPLLSDGLVSIADASQQIMVVTDVEGRVLWRQGNTGILRRADDICLAEGAAWSEEITGTNAIGTALASRAPVQVHSAEHFVRSLHGWTCAAAPVRDPRDGRIDGDRRHQRSGEHLPSHDARPGRVGGPAGRERDQDPAPPGHRPAAFGGGADAVPASGGRALAVDANGWLAAVTGMPPVDRLPLPKSVQPGRVWLPSLGMCRVEPLPGGWLVQVADGAMDTPPRRVVLDLSMPGSLTVNVVSPVGTWTQRLSPRHAELLYALARCPEGRTASELAEDIFGDPTRTVTVRAEISRLRRHLAEVLAHRPYRFGEGVEVEVIGPENPGDLLPRSKAPVVVAARDAS